MRNQLIVDLDEERSSRDARKRKDAIEIDMNPMVDLAFLLLTFFMLTTTFARPQTMELVMPAKPKPGAEEQEQPVKESKTLSLVLSGADELVWYQGITNPQMEQTTYSTDGLHQLLLATKVSTPGLVVLIKPLASSNYKNLVDILDEMNACEIERYAIVEISEAEQQLLDQHKP